MLAVDRSTAKILSSADRLTGRIGQGAQILSGSIDQVGQVVEKGFDGVQNKLGDIDGRLGLMSGQLGILGGQLQGIDSTLTDGFTAISLNLKTIDTSIHGLAVVCDLGFDKVAAQTARSNKLLEDLVSLIKTPTQVWAKEQFEYAKECVSRDLWEDAFKFADKAVNGDDRNAGFHIEPAFHFLRSDILLHYPEVGEDNAFVEKALEGFSTGSKYCDNNQDELQALFFYGRPGVIIV